HVNWLGDGARGIETFFLGPTEDPYLSHLASRENRDSGYSLTALREILEGVYANLRQEESRRLAVAVQEALFSHLGEVAPGIVDRGVKTAPFVVLVGTDMPAVLAEVSALSSEEEARLLELPAYREYIALAIFSGIDTYARSAHEPDYSAS
ncbi:MAG: N-acetylmuramoyl-L-alanine amidase, partial [Thermoanaerobaculia bacterium]|nr:N-acetylmuramoyl-L-alanine amidase [Thermoanaerobaculia bacterium]